MRLIKPDFKITKEHGVWFERGGFQMCAVYHPSALLRDPRKKEDMLVDMKALKAKLDALKPEEAAQPEVVEEEEVPVQKDAEQPKEDGNDGADVPADGK